MSFILLGILNSQVSGAAGGAYELIESNILTSSASTITFSSIPTDYKHLQLRMVNVGNGSSSLLDHRLRFNGDGGSNYSWHQLYGTGSSVVSTGAANNTSIPLGTTATNGSFPNEFAAFVVDILDYTNTSKATTVRALSGTNSGTSNARRITLASGAWHNTATISSMLFFNTLGYGAGSRFSLYGIRG